MFNKIRGLNQKPAETVPYAVILQITNYKGERANQTQLENIFDYCSPLWDTCGKTLKDKLQRVQSRAARVITGTNYDTRSVDILAKLEWKTLQARRKQMKSILIYKILNEQSAPYLRNSFIKTSDCDKRYQLRNSETDLALPRPRTNFLKRSFKYSGAMLWNNLPDEAKRAKSLRQFKRSVCS